MVAKGECLQNFLEECWQEAIAGGRRRVPLEGGKRRMPLEVGGLGFRVQGLGFRVQGLGFRV